MSIKSFKMEKLIRDHIPHIMREKGISLYSRVMEKDEYILRLKEKLLEEGEEVQKSRNDQELAEELADVLEIIHALSHVTDITMEQIEKIRLKKRQTNGGFDHKLYNSHLDIQENNPAITYYLEKPEQYPLIKAPEHMSDCLFCQFARREKEVSFFETFTHCYAIKDSFPVSKGHVLIIPNEHTENWFTAREEVLLDMMRALQLVKTRLDREYNPHGYNIGTNCGEVAGQSIMHLHLHLIPRYSGDMKNPKGGVRGVIPSKQTY